LIAPSRNSAPFEKISEELISLRINRPPKMPAVLWTKVCQEVPMKRHRILISALTTLVIGWLSAAEAQPIPSSAVVCYLVGRIYFDNKGNAEVGGYFTDINGIGASDSLFKNGKPSESTAFFTFHTTVSISPLPSNGDITPLLGSAGLYDIYYNPKPQGDWSNPGSFASGQMIAHFSRPELLLIQFDSFSFTEHTVTETLLSSQDFVFKGHRYNFKELTPGGITLTNFISNTPVSPTAGFAFVVPYAGNGVAVASQDRDEQ
jgi:hypothetical protein